VVETSGAKLIDPKIQQRQVTHHAIEKFRDEGAIRRRQIT
jgi:hypothetical protein